jgi:hypothetical protein
MENTINILRENGLWNDELVYFDPKRIQVQYHGDSKYSIGVMLTDISIREYLEKINFDYSDKPTFSSILDEFDEFEWGLRIFGTAYGENEWHFLINFDDIIDDVVEESVWDPITGAKVVSRNKNSSSSTIMINKFFPLNPIHVGKTKSQYLADGNTLDEWADAISSLSFEYDYKNDSISSVYRCYNMFFYDIKKVEEWRQTSTGAHNGTLTPVSGIVYQHIYHTRNNQFVEMINSDIQIGKVDYFEDSLQIGASLNPLYVAYSSFKRDDGLTGIDIFSD